MSESTLPEVLRVIIGCADAARDSLPADFSAQAFVREFIERLKTASPPRGGDGAGEPGRRVCELRDALCDMGCKFGTPCKRERGEVPTLAPLPPEAEAGEPTRELKSCPFCGGQAHAISQGIGSTWGTGCMGCGASMVAASYPAARGAWNRRAQPIPGAGEGRQDYWHYDERGNWVPGNAPPAPAPVDMLEKLRAASGQPERAPQSPPPTESSGPHGSPPPATGEVGQLIAVLNTSGQTLAANALASQQREIERLREQPAEVMFPNHPLRKDTVYTLESVGPILDRAESAEAALATAQILRLRKALEPFARIAEYLDSKQRPADDADELHVWETIRGRYPITAGDFRRARAALSSPAPQDAVIVPLNVVHYFLTKTRPKDTKDGGEFMENISTLTKILGAPTRG